MERRTPERVWVVRSHRRPPRRASSATREGEAGGAARVEVARRSGGELARGRAGRPLAAHEGTRGQASLRGRGGMVMAVQAEI